MRSKHSLALAVFIGCWCLAAEDVVILNVQGERYCQNKDYARAKEVFMKALKLDGNNTRALNNLSFTLIELGEYQEAISYSNQALLNAKDGKGRASAYFNMGLAYEKEGKVIDAISSYEKVLKYGQSNSASKKIRDLVTNVSNETLETAHAVRKTGYYFDDSMIGAIKKDKRLMASIILANFDLDPQEEMLRGIKQDINGDSIKDFIIEDSMTCGNGGCGYAIIDGANWELLADFFGRPIYMLENTVNGLPVIETYSHQSADSGLYCRYEYDGQKYQTVKKELLTGKSCFTWFDDRKELPPIYKIIYTNH